MPKRSVIKLKKALRVKKLTIGSWVTIAHPAIAEIMAKAGFDWLAVDLEHSVITIREAEELIRIIDLCGVVPLVRISGNDPVEIKRVMDAGAHGVIVPMVNTREDAMKAVSAMKYPPLGTRGVGLARAQGYGVEFEKYKEWVNKESVIIVQIEHLKAVGNLADILRVDGVDAFFVGPYDLSASMGKPGELEHPDMVSALKRIMDVSRKLKKTAGYHVVYPYAEIVTQKLREGYRFIAYATDFLFLGEMCRQGLKDVREIIRQEKL